MSDGRKLHIVPHLLATFCAHSMLGVVGIQA